MTWKQEQELTREKMEQFVCKFCTSSVNIKQLSNGLRVCDCCALELMDELYESFVGVKYCWSRTDPDEE